MTRRYYFVAPLALAAIFTGLLAYAPAVFAQEPEMGTRVEVEAQMRSSGTDTDADGRADVRMEARDEDDDADGVPTTERDAGAQPAIVDNERAQDTDDDGDGLSSEVEAGANYNNSRSNRSTLRGSVVKELDKATPQVRALVETDAASPLLYQGISVRVPNDVCVGDDCDDGDSEREATPQDVSLHIAGTTVRGWNAEQKEAVRARLDANSEITTMNDLGIWIASQAIGNESLIEIETDNAQTDVRYRTRLRLFGFVPIQASAVAQARSDGEVEVRYPWYAFLASKGDQSVYTQLASDVRARHNGVNSE